MPYNYIKRNVKAICIDPGSYKELKLCEIYTGDIVLTANRMSPRRWKINGFPSHTFLETRFKELPISININTKTI